MFEEIATILSIIAQILGGKVGNLSLAFIQIVQAVNRMHIAQTGKPIDPSLLTPEEPVA